MSTMYDENYGNQPVLQDISRQRAFAKMLQEQGMQQEQGQMVSGRYVAPSWTQQLAQALKPITAAYVNNKADAKQKDYNSTKNKALSDILAGNKPQSIQDGTTQPTQAPERTFDQFGSPTQGQDLTPQPNGAPVPNMRNESAQEQMARVQPQVLQYMQQYGNTPEAQYMLAQLGKQDDRAYAQNEKVGDRAYADNRENTLHTRDRNERVFDINDQRKYDDIVRKDSQGFQISQQDRNFVQQFQMQKQSQGFQASQNAGNHAFEAQQNKMKIDAANPMGAGTMQTNGAKGDEFLSSIPENQAAQVKALAEGRMAFPSGFALKTPYWQQMLSAVAQYDPNFDAINYNARAKTRNDFTAGKSAMNIKALNTAISHLGKLDEQIGGTASHSFTPLNYLQNKGAELTGSSGVTNYKQTGDAVANELTQVFRGSGGAEADVKRYLEQLSPDASLEQKKAAVKNITALLHSRTSAIADQYNQGMGTTKDPLSLLNPEAQAVINRIQSYDDKGGSSTVYHYDAQGNLVK